jgi:electron transfer flavoprotein alpha subunit
VTESNSRSEQNKKGYEQARDFHLLAPCAVAAKGGVYNAVGHGWMPRSQVVGITENEIGKISL